MKNIKSMLVGLVAVFALAGCASTNQGVPAARLDPSLSSENEVKVIVGSKVSATSEGTVVLGFMNFMDDDKYADGVVYGGDKGSWFDTTSKIRSAAAYKAMRKSGADVLVAPTYVTEVHEYLLWRHVTVTVNAYKGRIAGFKSKN
jgi:hypothetical protein|tara:strand:- start:988 stop:1422 length:435 start_codon:yes stop_codon:yes gene_type:complete